MVPTRTLFPNKVPSQDLGGHEWPGRGGTALPTAIMESDLAQVPGLSTSYIHRRSPCFPDVHFPLGHRGSQMSQTVHGASGTTPKPGQYPAFLLDCGNLPKVFKKGRCTLSHPGGVLRSW